MIVCVCNNISEGKIHQAVDAGMTSMAELRKQLGVGTCCGKCHSCAKHVLRECLNNANQTHQSARPMVFHPSMAAA
ncbi:MAG: Bacterioferritin-associated ferredoxin [Herbaspirillum frisingense]|uniref:Bacterioferritin-associated ferredoxin n=1 Tax=Herbaspirillum frisingense TaxID=92645 RepID=A0A7V8JSA0_9BURK|nr:MAG: Bacterioferritin-associated ferredoxin [Herbaspirillum frisingense]